VAVLLTAPVIKIIDQTLVDGPGNRTAVFFQQCNLACRYCHNPETLKLCCHCGDCQMGCPAGALKLTDHVMLWNKQRCIHCDHCIKVCPNHSSPKVTEMSVDEVFAAIAANLPFIRGITASGGECSLYLPFLTELFTKCQSIGLTCLIDSNGTVPLWNEAVMTVCDGVMLDVKAWDDDKFFRLTDGHNDHVKKNLCKLAQMKKLTELRVVCLEQEDWVDASQIIQNSAEQVTEHAKEHTLLKLIRFRSDGVTGPFSRMTSPSSAKMEQLKQLAAEKGFQKIKIVCAN